MSEMIVKQSLKCGVHMPPRARSRFQDGKEVAQSLPPYAPVEVYSVDEYSSCPTNWGHGSDVASSYFMGIDENKGLWLDFNECMSHTHDVAIVLSVQGINPITGQKMVGQKALKLEQYHKKCPIHNVKFKQERYCSKCKFKWPGQNYLSSTGTPYGYLWLDGFREPDGTVRQYIFTPEKMRSIAAQLIGEERVFAMGIAFYLSKDKKPVAPKPPARNGAIGSFYWDSISGGGNLKVGDKSSYDLWGTPKLFRNKGPSVSSISSSHFTSHYRASAGFCGQCVSDNRDVFIDLNVDGREITSAPIKGKKTKQVTPTKNYEVGAGTLIDQKVYDDPKPMDYWEAKPAGMIFLNYCDQETKKKILDGGKRADETEGFMQGLNVGG